MRIERSDGKLLVEPLLKWFDFAASDVQDPWMLFSLDLPWIILWFG